MSEFICAQCGRGIPDKVIAARRYTQEEKRSGRFFCDVKCSTAYKVAHGLLSKAGRTGNEAQARIKAETGSLPHAEKRRVAVAKSNREKPRRKRG